METSPCKDQKQGQGQGLDHKDQDKDKDLTHKDKDKDLTPKDQDKDKDLTPKDKDLRNVLKESLRTRTKINIPANQTLLLKTSGGTDAWAVHHLKFWGTVPPVPLGLRPCTNLLSFDVAGCLKSQNSICRNFAVALRSKKIRDVNPCPCPCP